MEADELARVLKAHLAWFTGDPAGVRANLGGAYLGGADLRDADLRDAYLGGADLRDADLRDADLRGAYLRDADLRGADLRDAYLGGADLRDADLRDADLRGAYLRDAYLRGADLRDAYLGGAYLRDAYLGGAYLGGADLRDADLRDADLRDAYLGGAKNIPPITAAETEILPRGSEIIGWKKCRDNVMVKVRVPADARRSNATGRKCRAEFVDVLEVVGATEARSTYHESVVYRVGERVTCDEWNEDRWVECGGGIHFFLTKEEAEAYV